MKKKTPPVLRDSDFSFDDTATVMLTTHDHLFQLALFLNEAYLLQLARIEDLFIGDLPHPCFFYHNEEARLVYILIARPLQPEADPAFTDPANGNFTPTGADQVARKTGDPRWWK